MAATTKLKAQPWLLMEVYKHLKESDFSIRVLTARCSALGEMVEACNLKVITMGVDKIYRTLSIIVVSLFIAVPRTISSAQNIAETSMRCDNVEVREAELQRRVEVTTNKLAGSQRLQIIQVTAGQALAWANGPRPDGIANAKQETTPAKRKHSPRTTTAKLIYYWVSSQISGVTISSRRTNMPVFKSRNEGYREGGS